MILKVIAMRDAKAEVFGQPQFVPSIGTAIRSFTDSINNDAPDNVLARHSSDFSLYHLADYDDADGSFTNITPAKLVITGDNAKVQK